MLSNFRQSTDPSSEATNAPGSLAKGYVVVARRYRPQTFEELIGQEHVAKALQQAISTEPRRPRLFVLPVPEESARPRPLECWPKHSTARVVHRQPLATSAKFAEALPRVTMSTLLKSTVQAIAASMRFASYGKMR